MILDRIAYAKKYLGISNAMDTALEAIMKLEPQKSKGGDNVQLDGDRVFYKVMDLTYTDKPVIPEYHKKYIDIHVPFAETEEMAVCAAPETPLPSYDAEKDFGLMEAGSFSRVYIPAGWFCVCFPHDGHAPGLTTGADLATRKAVFKVIDE